MPQASDLVINNGAATPVAKTFSLMAPAAGDGSYANWRLKEGAIASAFPRVAVMARANGNKARKANIKLVLPSSSVDVNTGLTKIGPSADFNIDVTIPDEFPESLKNDFVAYATNLVATTLIKAVIRDAYPTT